MPDTVTDLLETYGATDADVARLLCDDHPADHVALRVIGPDHAATELTYGQLRERSARFAAALANLGVQRGDRVATLMGKSVDLVVALLGIWRRGAVHVPLFTAFAQSAIQLRLDAGDARVVLADYGQLSKLDDLRSERTVVAPGGGQGESTPDHDFATLLETHSPSAETVALGGDGTFVQLFTSGTTGAPKGVPIPVRAIASFRAYLHYGLDVRADDVFWNAADPGWAYGLYYGIIAPLAAGRTTMLLGTGFSPELTWQVMREYGVTNFAAAPTVYRALRSADDQPPEGLRLRRCSSAGEPLNPDVVEWGEHTLGVPIRDHYGQTELGMCVVNGWHDDVYAEVRPGSMGRPMPGWNATVLRDEADDPAPVGTLGRVAIDLAASPLMWFRGYVAAPDKTAERFSTDGRWYYTGDAGQIDDDGHIYFSARDDDVIIMAGYRIGPFEVESSLSEHPAVAESAVVGVPDELRGEAVQAHVVLRDPAAGSDELAAELQQHVKRNYAAHAYPRSVHFVTELPKTPSGKIQRFKLRAEATQGT